MYDAGRTIAERGSIRQLRAHRKELLRDSNHLAAIALPRRRYRAAQQACLGRAARALRRPLPRRARRVDGRRRPPVDPQRPRSLDELAAVGRQRLRPRLRRLPAAGRPGRRPTGPAPCLLDFAWRVRRRITARRIRPRRDAAHRNALHQGHVRRLHGTRGPLDHHDDVQGGAGAQQGALGLHGDRRDGLLARARDRRPADRGRLALGVLPARTGRTDRADRGHQARARPASARRASAGSTPWARSRSRPRCSCSSTRS